MEKPYLIVVTGRPGAGKSTLAEKLSEAWRLPLISRDRIKEGYVHTAGLPHEALPKDANGIATKIFFDTLLFLAEHGVSLVAEAAFQHPVWESGLAPLLEKARIFLVICRVDGKQALDRSLRRGLADDGRAYFHGDTLAARYREGVILSPTPYEEPHLDVATIPVNTENGYSPSLEELKKLIFPGK